MFANCKVIHILIISSVQIIELYEFFRVGFSPIIIYCMFVFELCIVYNTAKLQKLLSFRLSLILH